jgi:hypothetical protein
MGASTSDRAAMICAYLDVSQMVLEEDGYRQRLADKPSAELAAAGWPLPEGTAVEVAFFDPGAPDGEMIPVMEITDQWWEGMDRGSLKVEFAGTAPPDLEIVELSESELRGAAGGMCVASAIGPMPPPGLP